MAPDGAGEGHLNTRRLGRPSANERLVKTAGASHDVMILTRAVETNFHAREFANRVQFIRNEYSVGVRYGGRDFSR